ncbi:MAG: hypothetical protein ACP5OK_09390 [Thermoprotei archaeon]
MIRGRIFWIMIVSLVIMSIVVGIYTMSYIYLNGSLRIIEGSTYVYEIIPNSNLSSGLSNFIFGSHVKQLNSCLDPNNYNYFVTVQKDYWKAVKEEKYKGFRVSGYNSSESGNIVSEYMYIIIKIDSIKNDILANVTLSFREGYARFGLGFGLLPVTDTGWKLENGSYVSYFNVLNMSRILIINRINNNVQDKHNTNLGEWPFWLNTKNKYNLISYSFDDTAIILNATGAMIVGSLKNASLSNYGVANVIFVNSSISAPSGFSVGKIYISPEDQIYNNKWLLNDETIILNVTSEEKTHIMNLIKEFYNSSTAKEVLEFSIFPLTMEYRNNSIIIFNDILPNLIELNDKPWIYIKNVITSSRMLASHQVIDIKRGIEYNGSRYIVLGGFPGLNSVSYERTSGLLLYINVSNNDPFGSLNYIIPSVLTRAFGLVGFEITKYFELSMRLINYYQSMKGSLSLITLSTSFIVTYVKEYLFEYDL